MARLPEDWEAWAVAGGQPRYRGGQVFRWIHQRLVSQADGMSDLPKALRTRLEEEGLDYPFEHRHTHKTPDGTRKLLLRLEEPDRKDPQIQDIESVLIPQLRDRDPDVDADDVADVLPGRVPGHRVTQCVSSQVGCAMGCVFCASGLAGLRRSLGPEEIVAQVLLGRALLGDEGHLTNVVFMGMGEPLHNYDAVVRALRLMTHPDGLGLSFRRVTVSTSGLVPEILRLGEDFGGRVQLAISLHSSSDERRSALMPINRKYPLRELTRALRAYPLPKRRRITIEYTLIRGVNDGDDEVRGLAALLRGIPVKVNLIPMNPVSESPLGAPDFEAVNRFRAALQERGMTCMVRTRRGDEITAACGQLALQTKDGSRVPAKVKRRLPAVPGDP